MRMRILAIMAVLLILLSTASAFAIVQAPYISVTKEVSPDFFDEGDTVTITINISGEGEPALIHNPVDVMLVIDRSGSMAGQKLSAAKNAAKTFVDQLNSSYDRSGLVSFNDHATLDQPLTFVQQDVKDEIDDMTAGGYTAIGDGILKALTELASNGREDAYLFEVLLSDGMNNRGTIPLEAAEDAAANGVIIFTIGLGSDADGETLQEIADATGGDYYYAPDSSDLEAIYQEIAEEIRDIAGSNVILTDILPEGVELSGDLPDGCSSEENPDGTTTITCTIPGNVNIGDSFPYSFNVTVNDPDLTEVNAEGSGITYNDYNGDPAEILFDNPTVMVCSLTDTPLECSSEGYREWLHYWNHPECGDDYPSYEEDQTCLCIYTEWTGSECSSNGFMLQARDELSGLPYCTEPLSQEVQDPTCDCLSSEYYRECSSDGFADVYYSWNYPYCGIDYSETEGDQSCLCIYTDWTDSVCVADGLMSQLRDELSGHEYCDGGLYQEVPNVQCGCQTTDTPLECSAEGTREWLHEWNYPYCDDDYYTDEQDASCNCLASEYYRLCTGDSIAEVSYSWNYPYCGADYSQPEEDPQCASSYGCGEWYDLECASDGTMEQERYCEDQYGSFYYEQQEVQDPTCDCIDTEYDRECISDGTASVSYEWNHDYCGDDYSQPEEDQSCLCIYTDWTDSVCVADGIMSQTRTEESGLPYCEEPLYQEVLNEQCSCLATEYDRSCVGDGTAEVSYSWNFGYCGEDYSQPEDDESCDCVYSEWVDDACVDDFLMRQTRYEIHEYSYCTGPFEQSVENEQCDCLPSEYDRECISDGTASVSYEWNFGYCGENYSQPEEDGECSCIYSEWVNDYCASDGLMAQIRTEETGYEYCEEPLYHEAENQECSCFAEETGRVCSGLGTANVSYEWNHDYCGEDYTQEEDDELCACAEGETRDCGSNVGRCEYGSQTCVEGQWSDCSGGVGPTGEICNDIDDNCNGETDEAGVCGGGGGGGSSEIEEDWCGNLFCGENETCENCSRDCGVCETTSGQGSDTGEGEICNPLWECGDWSECTDGKQARTCRDRWECEDPPEYDEERDCDGGTDDGITGLVTGQETPFQWWIALLATILSGLVYWQRGRISSGTGRILGTK